MIKKLLFLSVSLACVFVSCDSDDDDNNTSVPPLYITVINADEWSESNTNPISEGATVTLTYGSISIIETTNTNGVATFTALEVGSYTVQVSKNGASNLIDADDDGGYLPIGIFQTIAEIENYTDSQGNLVQSDAVPGDLKLQDYNGDGVINASDKIAAQTYTFEPCEDYNMDGAINENDMVNGSYIYTSDSEELTVYIGQ